jgi:hypothetical protein
MGSGRSPGGLYAWHACFGPEKQGLAKQGVRGRGLATLVGGQPSIESVSRFAQPALRVVAAALLVATELSPAAPPDAYASAKEKFERIESDRLPAGSRIELSAAELNAYVAHEAPMVTDGVRNPRLELAGDGLAHGTALIDFARVGRSQGHPPGWLLSRLLEGERPVSVSARIRSSGGQATVEVQRVEISGATIEGGALDFLIQHFLLALYPGAVVGHPFALGHRIERLDVRARSVTVVLGR